MKILIAGGGSFCGNLIGRLNRERHDVYQILSPEAEHGAPPEGRAIRYYFHLNDSKLDFVLSSVKPDAIVFLGAMNDAYDWSMRQSASSMLLSGLANMLCLAASNSIQGFVFLSTTDVYGRGHDGRIDESAEKRPSDIRALILSEGEELCIGFRGVSGLRPTVLRLSNVYGMIDERMEDFASRLYCAALRPEETPQNQLPDNIVFSPLYVSDAVDAIFKTLQSNMPNSGAYNVAGEDTRMPHVCQEVKFITGAEHLELPEQAETTLTVDATAFSRDFGYRAIVGIDAGLRRTHSAFMKWIKQETARKKKAEAAEKKERSFFKIIAPFVENAISFTIVALLCIFAEQNQYLSEFNFMLIYIMIISLVFGLLQSSISVTLACGFIIWRSLGREVQLLDIMMGFDILMEMLQMFIVGMLCGYTTDRFRTAASERMLELSDVSNELETIYEINERNIKIKEVLDSRLTSYENSLAKIYSITDRLNSLQVDEVFFSAINVVSEIMRSNDVSIYIVTGGATKMCRLVARSPQSERMLRKSVPLLEFGDLAECVQRDEIYVNREIAPGLPMMAAPIFSARDLVSIIMLWTVDFEDLTVYNVNNFLVLSKLISAIIEKAYDYTQTTASLNRLQDSAILNTESFLKILAIHQQAKKEGVAQYRVFEVGVEEQDMEETAEKVRGMLRNTDYIGRSENGQLQILLTNTNENDVKFVYDRFSKSGIPLTEVDI